MKKFFNQLKPQERRWLVGTAFVVFVILNWLLVWPQFGEWGRNTSRIQAARTRIAECQPEVNNTGKYTKEIARLQSEGVAVQQEDQASQFNKFYTECASENHVSIQSSGQTQNRDTSEFIREQEVTLNLRAEEKNLVDFLYGLGSSESMVRVRSMNLHADPAKHQLNAGVTLVASYMKKAPTPAPAARPAAVKPPAAKPDTNPKTPAPAAKPPSSGARVGAAAANKNDPTANPKK